MCCLFGIIDYGKSLSVSQKEHILTVLSKECELRGVDATGIAYNGQEKLHIYKRPLPAHKMKFRVLSDTTIIMGHTRMTTQGSELKNKNNHPFSGKTFALAHNGIIENDRDLRKSENLPPTDIETDSYRAREFRTGCSFVGLRQDYSSGSHEATESETEHILSESEKMERGQVIPVPLSFSTAWLFFVG